MKNDNIVKSKVKTTKSFSKKEQKIKLYVLNRKKSDGGGQGCYNIPNEIFTKLEELNIIKDINLNFTDRKENPMETYTLVEEYEFLLSKNIRKLIEYKDKKPGVLFVRGTGTKVQINRRRCSDQKTLSDGELDLEWFVKLYDENPRPSQIIYTIDINLKTLELDIKLNYNFDELDDMEELSTNGKTFIEEEDYSKSELYTKALDSWSQKIFFGPPGTGKSYNVTQKILEEQIEIGLILEGTKEYDENFVFRTTVYPEYSYYDFIGNIMPVVKDKNITYDFKPGVFTLALSKALKLSDKGIPIYLIIEEMSRGNIASIFGDIFQLLDRDEDGISEYKIDNDIISEYLAKDGVEEYSDSEDKKKEIYLPSNLNIFGTVNTSDQNVFVMDTAFKRRFEFEYVDIDPVVDKKGQYLNKFEFKLDGISYEWNNFCIVLNEYIVEQLKLQEDKQLGQFFIKFNRGDDEENYKQLQNKLLPYLWDDIHLINMSENSLFNTNYTSFSKVYKNFGEHINVFNDEFIKKLKVSKPKSDKGVKLEEESKSVTYDSED